MGVSESLPPALRAPLVVGYMLPFFGRQYWLLHTLLVISLGAALATLVATTMSEIGWWHVEVAIGATELLVIVAVVLRTWHNRAAVVRMVGGVR